MGQINLDTLPRTRKEAQELGSLYYLRDKPCPKGHTPSLYLTSAGECKTCVNQRNAKNQKARPKQAQARRKRWQERNPGKQLECQRAFHARNPGKQTEYTREWNAKNPEEKKAHSIRGEHLRRVRAQGNKAFLVSQSEIDQILKQPCLACGCLGKTTLDHLIPVVRGGNHSIGNLAPLCGSCNSSKRNKTWMEFRLFLKKRARLVA